MNNSLSECGRLAGEIQDLVGKAEASGEALGLGARLRSLIPGADRQEIPSPKEIVAQINVDIAKLSDIPPNLVNDLTTTERLQLIKLLKQVKDELEKFNGTLWSASDPRSRVPKENISESMRKFAREAIKGKIGTFDKAIHLGGLENLIGEISRAAAAADLTPEQFQERRQQYIAQRNPSFSSNGTNYGSTEQFYGIGFAEDIALKDTERQNVALAIRKAAERENFICRGCDPKQIPDLPSNIPQENVVLSMQYGEGPDRWSRGQPNWQNHYLVVFSVNGILYAFCRRVSLNYIRDAVEKYTEWWIPVE